MSSFTISILDPLHCEIQPALARIIKPELSFTAVYYRDGFHHKERKEYQKSIMLETSNGNFLFPTGLLPRVVKYCKERNVPISVLNRPEKISFAEPKLKNIILREEQVRLVKTACETQRGTLVAPTGSGKSPIGIAIISAFLSANKDFKALWLCHTKDLMYQSAGVCKEELNIVPGIIGDNNIDLEQKITMATRQSFIKYVKEYGHLYDLVLVDEGHHITDFDGQYFQILNQMMAPLRFAVTATFPKDKQAALALEGMIGPIIDEITYQEGKEKGRIANVKIKVLKIPFRQDIKNLRKYSDVYDFGVVNNEEQHAIIIRKAKEHVEKGDSVLIIVSRIEHGRFLLSEAYQQDLLADFAEGETKTKERLQIKHDLNSKKLKCVIATGIWKEGINIPELNVIINAAGGKSEIATIQTVGRGLRKTSTKDEIIIYDCFNPSHHYLIEHFGERISTYSDMGWL